MTVFGHCAVGVYVLLSCSVLLPAMTPQPVGFAAGESRFLVGQSAVEGQATLFEGDQVQSFHLATRLHLKDGSRYVLGIGSVAAVHRSGLSLRFGSVQIVNRGRPSRVTVSSLEVVADKPATSATVYATEENRLSVLVHSGEVKVARVGGAPVNTLRAGELVSIKLGPKGAIQMDPDEALSELTRVQSEQLAVLAEAARDMTCLRPRMQAITRSFAGLSSQLAANYAARSAIQSKIDGGVASGSDLDQLASLDNRLRTLNQASAAFSDDLDNVVYQFHHPGPPEPFASPHTVHDHLNQFPHHGQHGHSIPGPYPQGPYGHHQVPPHLP